MKTGKKGIALIKAFEGSRLTAYRDGGGLLTIGYGHTGGVKDGETITQDQADELLAKDLEHAEMAVLCQTTVPLSQNQFDALVSFVYNIGAHNFFDSHVKKYVNLGKFSIAANWFAPWSKIHGVESEGLLRRRQAEAQLFLTPDG